MCAHELSLSSLNISDDSAAKTTTKQQLLVLMERNIGKIRGRGIGDDSAAKTTTKQNHETTVVGSHGAQYRQIPWSWQFQNLAEVTAQRA